MFKLKTAIYKITIVNLILGFTFSFGASFSWHLSIKNENYSLRIDMDYPIGVRIQQVKSDFKNFSILSKVSAPIQGGKILYDLKRSSKEYTQELNLKTYGVPGKLISHCKEDNINGLWKRHCDLDTEVAAGKASMRKKYDEVVCVFDKQKKTVGCNMLIEGSARDIKLAGFTLMGARELVLKGKYEALKNFSKIWNYRAHGGIDLILSQEIYRNKKLQKQFDDFFEKGTAQLKNVKSEFIFESEGSLNI
jgi:hypothetical protein